MTKKTTSLVRVYATILVIFSALLTIRCAVVHSHNHLSSHSKERTEDGAYNPRDRNHIESGEHHNEFDHESILGSAKEAEEFDHLPPEEAKRRLAILLTKMDLNGDQHIDKQELKAWILRSFKTLSIEEAQENLEDADENGDGKITWKEYVSYAYGSEENDEESLSINNENQQLIKDDKIMWTVADTNRDDILEGDEWVAFSHPEEHPNMLPIILEQTLREKDINKDGSIDFQEYIGDRGHDRDKEWLHVEKDRFDNELDKDQNGQLNGNEILSWIVPSNEEIAEEEVDHLFSTSDDDQNEILSVDEVLNHHDIFVGSEATDYGDHLQNIHQFQDEL